MRGRKRTEGQLRIIGGRWRGRKVPVADVPGLRPTTDRIRETLFNWLAPEIVGARCLDLFAGSGALGLEALSRGAVHCDFVDSDRTAAACLQRSIRALDCADAARVHCISAADFIRAAASRYDLVFIDPPFDSELIDPTLEALHGSGAPADDALFYLEYPPPQQPQVPASWQCWRSKRSGGVVYELYRRN